MTKVDFELDKQTLDDLNIFPRNNRETSVMGLFEQPVTIGGKDKLTELFSHPLTDGTLKEQRIAARHENGR